MVQAMEVAGVVACVTHAMEYAQGDSLSMPLALLSHLVGVLPAPFARQFVEAGGLASAMLAR